MEDYKKQFIEFMVRVGVLSFGDFTTKSGRQTPYFVNTGRYRTGAQLGRLASFYADAITARLGRNFDTVFGPAYKGIPLAATVAVELARRGHDVGYCFNRKEAKDHGEGGNLVGQSLSSGMRVLIVEDVTTAGTSIRETVPVLQAAAAVALAGLVVSVDRQERGVTERSALDQIALDYAMPTFSIVRIDDVIEYLSHHDVDGRRVLTDEDAARVLRYRARYGASFIPGVDP